MMIWLIGVGYMGIEYARVLNALGADYIAIGRGEVSAQKFEKETGHAVVRGGLEKFLAENPVPASRAIIALKIEQLAWAVEKVLAQGVRQILVEKPGFSSLKELDEICSCAKAKEAQVMLAYNRRFYASVLNAEQLIKEDGGVTSFAFEFTEWTHTIAEEKYHKNVLAHWLLANSSHVLDLAFFIGGHPESWSYYRKGENAISWHRNASIFCGAGISDKGALFVYQANWNAPGRWGVEILTKEHRFYLRPMEMLQVQKKGSVEIVPVQIEDSLDKEFKPGLYLQTKAFLAGDYSRFCTIEEQKAYVDKYYRLISGYTE